MRLSRLSPLVSLVCLGLVASRPAQAQIALPASLGVVIRHGETLCVYLDAPAPKAGSMLDIVVPGTVQTMAAASLLGRGGACHDDVTPRQPAFRLRLRSGTVPPLIASVGILGEARLSQAGHLLEWRPDPREPVTFSSCTSSEGVHLGAWQQGRRVWHAYVYVGQDLAADCTEAQARP